MKRENEERKKKVNQINQALSDFSVCLLYVPPFPLLYNLRVRADSIFAGI